MRPNGWGADLNCISDLQDSAVAEDLHEVLMAEVEDDFEVSLTGAGEAGIDEESGVGVDLVSGCVVGRKGETPGGMSEDVAGVERGFVNADEFSGLGAETIEKGFL